MKKPTVYILMLVMLLCCLSGCMRNDSATPMPTPSPTAAATPAPTAKPTQKPSDYSDGMVNDHNGIIEDNDGNAATPDKPNDGLMDDSILNDDVKNDLNPHTPVHGTTDAPRARK